MPRFEIVNYETVEEMNEYITSDKYKTSDEYTGVCYAIQHHIDEENPNNYTFSLHFSDQSYGGFFSSRLSTAIPNQSKPVWNAYTSSPDILSYYRY